MGHYKQTCQSKPVSKMDEEDAERTIQHIKINEYNATIFKIGLLKVDSLNNSQKGHQNDFKTQLIINNHLSIVLLDTSAKISVCSIIVQTKR